MSMLRSRIIPILLMSNGGLIKTTKFGEPKYVGDPINIVKIYNEKEVDELVIYDIHASRNGFVNLGLLERIAKEARMPMMYGGGVSDDVLAEQIISLGIEKISVSNAYITNPNFIKRLSQRIGTQSTVVTLDVRWEGDKYSIYKDNGTVRSNLDFVASCKDIQENGAGELVINLIDREGSLCGFDTEIIAKVKDFLTIPLTISGGCGSDSHIDSLIKEFSPIGVGVGTFFIFKGKHKAVLVSYYKHGFL